MKELTDVLFIYIYTKFWVNWFEVRWKCVFGNGVFTRKPNNICISLALMMI